MPVNKLVLTDITSCRPSASVYDWVIHVKEEVSIVERIKGYLYKFFWSEIHTEYKCS